MSIPPQQPSTLDRDDILRTAYLPHREATGPTGSMFPEASARLPANRSSHGGGGLIPRTGFEPLASPRGYRPLLPKPATVTAPVVVTPQNQNQNQNSYVHTQARPPPPPTIMPRYSSSEFSFTPPSHRPPPAWPGHGTTGIINPPLPLPLANQQNQLPQTSTVTPSRGHRRPQVPPPWWRLHPQYQQQQQQPPPTCPSRGHLPPRNSWSHNTIINPRPQTQTQTQTQTQIQHYQPASITAPPAPGPTVTPPWPPAHLNANGKRPLPAVTAPVPVQVQIQVSPPGHHAHHAPRSGSGSGSTHPHPPPSTLKSPVKKKPRTRTGTGIPAGAPSREAVRHALLNPHLSASGSLLGKCLREFSWGRKEAVDYAVGGGDGDGGDSDAAVGHGMAQPHPEWLPIGNLTVTTPKSLPAANLNSAQVQLPPPSQAAGLPTVVVREYGGQASTSTHNGVQTVNPADLQLQLEQGPMMLSDEEVMFITAYRESMAMAMKHRHGDYTPPSASLTPDDSGAEAQVNPGNDSSLAHNISDSNFDVDNSSLDRDCGWPPNPDPIAEELGLQMPPLALGGRGDVFGEDLFGAVPWSPLDDGDVDVDVDLDLDMEWELDGERLGLGKGKGKGKVGMGSGSGSGG